MLRRDFLKKSAVAGAATALPAAAIWSSKSHAADAIKVGALYDLSGYLQPFGTNMYRCLQLGVAEVNAAGGLLGRKIEIVNYDMQSKDQLAAQFARRLGLSDKVDIVHGGLNSSTREVVRPVLRGTKTLYFYNVPYEGGVCDGNIVITGSTPGQLLGNLVPAMIKRFGKRGYILGADFNFGHLSAKWTEKYAKENGGTIVGKEFFPFSANQFGPTISRLQRAKPDWIINTFIGAGHGAFYGQWMAAGMKKSIPIASQTFGAAGEHLRMPPAMSEGIIVCHHYIDELTLPANKAFIQRFTEKFGKDYGYLGYLSATTYQGWWLWVEAVKKAGSTKREAVLKALKSGIKADGPGGPVSIDPKTHHTTLNMYLSEVKKGRFEVLQTFENVPPTDPGPDCDLIKNPNTNKVYAPKI